MKKKVWNAFFKGPFKAKPSKMCKLDSYQRPLIKELEIARPLCQCLEKRRLLK